MSVWIEQAASILFSFESKLAGFLRKKEALKKVSSPLELNEKPNEGGLVATGLIANLIRFLDLRQNCFSGSLIIYIQALSSLRFSNHDMIGMIAPAPNKTPTDKKFRNNW